MPADGHSTQPQRDACVANFCCQIGGIWPKYVCRPGMLPNSPNKLIAVARQLECSTQLRQGIDILMPIQQVTSSAPFAGGQMDQALGSLVLARQQMLGRMLGSAESVLSDACDSVNGTEGDFPLPPKTLPDVPLVKDCSASTTATTCTKNSHQTPVESLVGSIFHHYALTEFILGSSSSSLDTGNGHGLNQSITSWQWSLRYSDGPECVLTTQDQLVTTVAWLYAACMRANRTAEAQAALKLVNSGNAIYVLEADAYAILTQMYAKSVTVAHVTKLMEAAEETDPKRFCTLAYALGHELYLSGNKAGAIAMWKRVVAAPSWNSLDYLAAEAELFNAQGVYPPPGGSGQ